MKTFYEHLLESEQTYKYRVKVAGGCDNECLKELESKLAQFDIINMSSPKTTPVMEDPLDFPGVKNMEVCMFEVEIAYPAGQDALYDMIESCTRKPKSQIKIVSDHFAQSWEDNEGAEAEEAPILEKEYDGETNAEKEAKELYADPAKVVPETPTRFKIAGGNTPKAQTTNDLPMGDKSAMGSVKPKLPNVKSFAR
jgi:hypothetical protein